MVDEIIIYEQLKNQIFTDMSRLDKNYNKNKDSANNKNNKDGTNNDLDKDNYIIQLVDKHVNTFLADKAYHPSDNDIFIDYLTKEITDDLFSKGGDNFKFIVNIVLYKDVSLGIDFVIGGLMNNDTDGMVNRVYAFENIGCIVTVMVSAL